MDTPIVDFVRRYSEKGPLRLHMPGHKGSLRLGMEALDITEVSGADSLYEAEGIIAQSEANASVRFGCPTYYSTEGSSQCIRAMLHLATVNGCRAVAAARNVHKTFLSAVALLDLQVEWLYPQEGQSYLSCVPEPEQVDAFLAEHAVAALYITSPDYLGNVADVAALARVCHAHGVLLLVDNAHGAYLRFLIPSQHPMDLGADMACSSAHKTLPVLTGGAYLHIGGRLDLPVDTVRQALALFGSTSPSYLILQSLDFFNGDEGYIPALQAFVPALDELKHRLAARGWTLMGDEPLKLTLCPKAMGYTGGELAAYLRRQGMECEFSDPDYLVLMFAPDNGLESISVLEDALERLEQRPPLPQRPPESKPGERVCSIREAMLSSGEVLPIAQCLGRVLASASVGCPPAVPIAVCGERIDQRALECFAYYGVDRCRVLVDR